jgi:hypothetical protein
MKTKKENGIPVIIADAGNWLMKGNAISDTEIYLGKFDKPENWTEISNDTKIEIELKNMEENEDTTLPQ